ncbi:MAG: hypothetical protein WC919_00410 [Candidatus Paceibacterota bacterium]|jgi:hypothetical protein
MIEIVTHCFGERFATILNYHLSSIVLNESQPVTVTVIFATNDKLTTKVLSHFGVVDRPWIMWNFIHMPIQSVYQRPIGRNLAAKSSKADVIWFTDADYVFGDGCLNSIWVPQDDGIYHPEHEYRTTRKVKVQMIDALLKKSDIGVVPIDPSQFVITDIRRAVGGVQIVSGDTARKIGYLPDNKDWQKPLEQYNRDDGSAFWRNLFSKFGTMVIPNVFRI